MYWAIHPKETVRNKYIMKGRAMVQAGYAANTGTYPDFYGWRYYGYWVWLMIVHPIGYSYYFMLYTKSILLAFSYEDVQLIGVVLCCATITYMYGIVTTVNIAKKPEIDSVLEMVGRGFSRYSRPLMSDEQGALDAAVQDTLRLAKISTYALMSLAFIHLWTLPIIRILITGMISTVSNGTVPINLNAPLPIWSPIGSENWITYTITFVNETVLSTLQYAMTNGLVILYVGLSQQLSGNLNFLTISLGNIYERSVYLYSQSGRDPTNVTGGLYNDKHFHKCLNACLKENIEHHVNLIRFFHKLQDIVGLGILAIFTGIAIIISTAAYSSLLMFQREEDTAIFIANLIVWVYYLVAYSFILVIYCIYGQDVNDRSDQILDAFYGTPWMDADLEFRKMLLTSMCLAQRNMKLSGAGIISANRESIIDIMKTSFSYLNILLASL